MTEGVDLLNLEHFAEYPIWRFDEANDLYFRVSDSDDTPYDSRDISIKAKFYAPNGWCLDGYINGVRHVFSIGIFLNGECVQFNRNIADSLYTESFNRQIELMNDRLNPTHTDIFPLRYETQFNRRQVGFENFDGMFFHPGSSTASKV